MTGEKWYWQYQVKIFNEDAKNPKDAEEIRSGIVAADSIVDAIIELNGYYDDALMEVQMLKAIVDDVFEFKAVNEDKNFDYYIFKKENK